MNPDIHPLVDGLLDHLKWLREEGQTRVAGTNRSEFVNRGANHAPPDPHLAASPVLMMHARRMPVCADGNTELVLLGEPALCDAAGREVMNKILYALGFEAVGEPAPYSEERLRAAPPAAVITFGAKALEEITGRKQSLGPARGKWRKSDVLLLMPTFDPVLMNDPKTKGLVWEDLLAVLSRIGHELPQWSRKFAK